jgi:sec-independent protein translocase protein TatA
MLARMFGLGTGEMILIVVVLVLVFGATKLPQLGEGLGKSIRSFKRAVSEVDQVKTSVTDSAKAALTDAPAKTETPAASAPATTERRS